MAVIVNPFLSEKARGSVGGITATMGISGPVMKRKATPVRRVRSTQPKNRSIIGFLSREWGTLSDAQREAWRDYAVDHPVNDKFGNPFVMSGINAYSKLNSGAIRLGLAAKLQVLPPATTPPATFLGLAAVTGATNPGEIDLTWSHNGTGIVSDYNEIWLAGPFQSPGRVEVISQFNFNTKTTGETTMLTLVDLLEGFWYWIRGRYTDEYGQTTAWLYDQATPKTTL